MAERVAAIAKKPKTKQKCSNICNHKLGFNSSGCPAEILLNLQRTAGNQAVQKLIKSGALQKKHKVDQLDDICRQEIVLEYRLAMGISKLKTKKQLQEEQGIKEEKSEVNKGKTTISKPELEIEAKKLIEKVTPEAKPTQVSKEKPAISRPELEIEAKKLIEKVTPEAKPTKETPGEASVLPGVSDKTLPSTAAPPSVSRVAVVPKAAPKEKVGTEIESPEESKEPEEATGLEKVAVKASPVSPKDDPAFQAVVELTKKTAAKEKAHASAKVKSAEAQAAVVSPSNEVESKAAAGQVQEMDQVTPKPFDRAAFKVALIKKIESIAPKNLEEADKLKESGKVKSIKGDLTAQVSQSKEQSQGEIKEKVEQAPDKSGIKPKPVTPLPPAEAGPSPKGINAGQAAPKPRSESDVSLQEGSKKLDQKMADANITEKMLKKSNEPGFISAANAKKASQANSVEAPKVYRKEEQSTLSKSQSEMTMAAKTQIGAMHSSRQKQLAQVAMQQVNSKGKDEKEREKVANHIQEIYNGTKEKVETILSKLDRDVDDIFEKGSTEAQKAFEDYVSNRMKIYKDERYDRIGGSILWAKDKLLGLPDEVNVFYEEGRNLYIKMMDGLLDRIAETVETGLTAAKNEISRGKKEIHTYINSLPESLKSVGQEAAKDIQSKFDNLEQSVDDKQNELVDSLAQKYVEKVQQLDTRIQEMKAENQGLVDAAIGALTGVIKTILSLKEMLLNVLSRVKEAVGLIISDPIGFLGNLVAGVKLGFQNFVSKIGKYLLEGLMGWLFGALAEAGIQMPESFDLKGILSLVLQILGLTYQNIRARAVKIVGEKVVSIIERTAGIFYNIITKGPAAIWEEIKEKLGDFKSMVLEPIKDFLITKVITAGVTWILGLLNPVSAFIKAAKAIYDIIMFFVERASQVMTLINAIVDSVVSIAKGNITVAATKVEQSLAKAIPVVIGLLAGLLGLGGISEKIKSIIKKIQSPIEKAIDWVIEKAVKLVKSAGKLLGFGKKEEQKEVGDVRQQVKTVLTEELKTGYTREQAKAIIKQIENRFKPVGLKLLELGEENEEGESVIVAEASPKLPLAYLRKGVPIPKGRSVVVAVQLILNVPVDVPATLLEPVGAEKTVPGVQTGGVVWTPSTTASTKLNIITWNTGDIYKQSNASHGERQFIEWLRNHPEHMENIESIKINNFTRSPCSECAPQLATLLNDIKKARKGLPVRADIYWTELHSNGYQPTSWQGLHVMQSAGWNLHAPNKALPPEKDYYADQVKVVLI